MIVDMGVGLDQRSVTALKVHQISTIGQLVHCRPSELMKMNGLGKLTVERIGKAIMELWSGKKPLNPGEAGVIERTAEERAKGESQFTRAPRPGGSGSRGRRTHNLREYTVRFEAK